VGSRDVALGVDGGGYSEVGACVGSLLAQIELRIVYTNTPHPRAARSLHPSSYVRSIISRKEKAAYFVLTLYRYCKDEHLPFCI
jgi:hypothetical protein